MSLIKHMLQSSCNVYSMTETVNNAGSAINSYTLESNPICRIQGMKKDRKERGGKPRSEATHKMWLLPAEINNLELGSKIVMQDDTAYTYEVVYFEDKIPIINSSVLDHVEVELKFREDWAGE